MKFSKMQAAGNDFILMNGMIEKSSNWNETAKKVCDRHFGIGADGLMFCERSSNADIKMSYYNSDGSRGEMCGNGIRCFAKFVYDSKIVTKDEFSVETDAGIKHIKLDIGILGDIEYLKVDMEKIDFRGRAVPCTIKKENILEEEIFIKEKKVIFKGIGKFELRETNPRRVVLPFKKKGESSYILEKKMIPSKKIIKFAAGDDLKKLLNEKECES